MVRPSHPRLMARVLDAVVNLGDTRGSSAHEVLSFIRLSNVSSKNLTLQVHRALKHAVNAGLLRRRSGRYKALATLNPNYVSNSASKEPPASKEPDNNQINDQKKLKSDVQAPISDVESSRTQKRKKKTTRRRNNSRHRNTKVRRKSRRSPYTRRSNPTQNRKRQQRKHTHENDEEFEDHSSEQDFLHRRDDSPILINRKTKRSRVSKRKRESDTSDESECNSDVSQKYIFQAKESHRKSKRKEARAKSKDRSASRARNPQLSKLEETENDGQRYDENHGSMEHNVARQEEHKDVERIHEPNNSNSGSILENSRD
ncbi:PREDICTED: serine/arginine-rich splicing factor 4-like [Cyphomyrmex costatus]|uniref:H15 domain-containing protein n=1 Tax=Cyphomyrmex costatus TaxID=456900 RepID=A0A151IDH9_9HYME|nr:PREDICTED: serine/arginine-rich splicing factor 4-like [Cyphomyrmex costatus]KYM98537.1 hypothetical protein ALC62_10756 [Cyphomyrmex costatus]